MLVVVVAVSGRGTFEVREVPSLWETVPMTCETARFEDGGRALELFRCRAVAAGTLPPGVYRPPDARWTSDLTRQDALTSKIVISRDGELNGIAVY